MEPWAATKRLYTSVEVTPGPVQVPIQVPIQWPLFPNFTLVVGKARTFHLALVYLVPRPRHRTV